MNKIPAYFVNISTPITGFKSNQVQIWVQIEPRNRGSVPIPSPFNPLKYQGIVQAGFQLQCRHGKRCRHADIVFGKFLIVEEYSSPYYEETLQIVEIFSQTLTIWYVYSLWMTIFAIILNVVWILRDIFHGTFDCQEDVSAEGFELFPCLYAMNSSRSGI